MLAPDSDAGAASASTCRPRPASASRSTSNRRGSPRCSRRASWPTTSAMEARSRNRRVSTPPSRCSTLPAHLFDDFLRGSPFGPLMPRGGTVPVTELTNSWLYLAPGLTAISTQGSFIFSFTDGTSGKPEYPAGSCAVAYGPPPGFPGDLTINGFDGGAAWGGVASSAKGQDVVAWARPSALPSGSSWETAADRRLDRASCNPAAPGSPALAQLRR